MSNYAGFVTEESVETKNSNLKFGLNQKVNIKEVTYQPNAGAGNTPGEAFDFVFVVNGTDVKHRVYPVTSVTVDNQPVTDPNHEEFKKAQSKLQAWCTSLFKCFITEEQLKSAIMAAVTNGQLGFKQYISAQLQAVGKEALTKTPLDIFLEYGSLNDGKKYLQVPKSRVHGKFVSKHVPGVFTEVKDTNGLRYQTEAGAFHPIQRSVWWLENVDSAKPAPPSTGSPQGLVHSTPQNIATNPFSQSTTGQPVSSAAPTSGDGDFNW